MDEEMDEIADEEIKEIDEEMDEETEDKVTDRHPEGKVVVVEGALDVGDHVLLIHRHGQNLSLPVDPDDAISGLVLRRHEYRVCADPVHVDAGAGLDVVKVDIAVLRDQVHHAVLLGHLHGHGEVALGLRGEERVHRLLLERRVPRGRRPHLDDVEFAPPRRPARRSRTNLSQTRQVDPFLVFSECAEEKCALRAFLLFNSLPHLLQVMGSPHTHAAPVLTYVRLQALLGLEFGGTVGALVGHSLRVLSPHVVGEELPLWE